MSFTLISGLSRQLMTRAKYYCNCTELNLVPQLQLLINLPFLFKTEQRPGSFAIPVLANHALVIAASKWQIPRFAGVLFLSPLFLLEARLCHHSVALNFKTNDEKSCVCLMIATHPFPGRGRLRKRERSLVWDGIQWAPQSLLTFSKNYLL